MIRIRGDEHIHGFERSDVFAAGTMTANWPDVGGLAIEPLDEIIMPGTRINVGMLAAGLHIKIDGCVTGYVEKESVLIEGRSPLASAMVLLDLRDTEMGTAVGYEVVVEPRKLHVRLAEVAVREFLRGAVPRFAGRYRDNVAAYLQEAHDLR